MGDVENPRYEEERTNSEKMQNVNFEERKEQLFQIAQNNEKDQQANLERFEKCFKYVKAKKLCKAKDEKGNTGLHYAAKAGNLEVCKGLVDRGADLNAEGQDGMKILPFAARYGVEKRAEDVWKCIEWLSEFKEVNLEGLAEKHHEGTTDKENRGINSVKRKLEAAERDKYNFTILHHAIQNTNWAKKPVIVENLLKSGNLSITDRDHQGNTSLHLAAQFDKHDEDQIFDVFFEIEGIDTNQISRCIKAKNSFDMTPLHIACSVGNTDSFYGLLKFCDDHSIKVDEILNAPNRDGMTPLCLAINSKGREMVDTLLKKGAPRTNATMTTAARSAFVFGYYLSNYLVF